MSDNQRVSKTDSHLYPEKVITTYGSDGSKHTSFVYSLESWATLSLFDFLGLFVGIAIAGPLASSVFLLFYLLNITNKPVPNSHNFFGGLAALYFLIDYHYGWLLSQLIGCLFSMENQYLMLYFNLALLLLHTTLFFYGERLVHIVENNKITAILLVLIIGAGYYFISQAVIDGELVKFVFRKN